MPEELARKVRAAAAASGRSMNGWVVHVLSAAVDPDMAGSEIERVRERLRQAGLLFESDKRVQRPARAKVAKARAAAGRGKPLSEIVIEDRG